MNNIKYTVIFTIVVALLPAICTANTNDAFKKMIKTYSEQEIIALDINEEYSFTLKNGTKKNIRLKSVKEYRDSVINMIRRAEVDICINEKPVRLICAPYVMPSEIDGLRIQADSTSKWLRLHKRVQFSIWDASDPIVDTNGFIFPMPEHMLFSHGMQTYGEVGHLGYTDGNPGGIIFYMEHGVDIAGYEGKEKIVSPIDGNVILIYPDTEINPDTEPYPGRENICSVAIQDDTGFVLDFAHLHCIHPSIKEGVRVKKGQEIGMLGNTCGSGNFSHLWITSFLSKADVVNAKFEDEEPFARDYWLNLYPWLVIAYKHQLDNRHLHAVARQHHTIFTGEEALLDGSNSLAWGKKIVSYKWQLHDGQTANKVKVTKRFDKPGTYMETFWIKDEHGLEDVDFCKVNVFPKSLSQKELATIFMTYFPTRNILINQPVLFRFWIQGRNRKRSMTVDFGNGTVIQNYISYSEIYHSYKKPGIYVVTTQATVHGLPVTQKQKVIVSGTEADNSKKKNLTQKK